MAVLTTNAKRRVVGVVLALLVAWPGVHYWMVTVGHADPWRLFGWAMYCQPRPAPRMFVAARERGDATPFDPDLDIERDPHAIDLRELQRRAGRELMTESEYARRQLWGRFAGRPDAVADRIFAMQPQVDRLRIGVRVPHIDPSTGRQAFRRSNFYYRRGD
jgi:hypothetical protein